MRKIGVFVLAAASAATLLAAGASATGRPGFRLTPLSSVQFPDRAFVLASTNGAAIASSAIHVTEDGRAVRQPSIVPADQTVNRTFGVVLVIDASASMRGAAIDNAMAAARVFQAHSPASRALGLVTFNRAVRVVAPPTTDRKAIAASLATRPRLAVRTRLWDAAGRAIDVLRQQKITAGSIVLLTDGRDIGSKLTPDQVVSKARSAGVRVFTVGLQSSQFNPEDLQSVARESNGAYAEAASPAALRAIYSALSGAACRRVHRSLRLPRRPWTSGAGRRSLWSGAPGVATWSYVSADPGLGCAVPPLVPRSADLVAGVRGAPGAPRRGCSRGVRGEHDPETETKHGEGPGWAEFVPASGTMSGNDPASLKVARAPARPRAPDGRARVPADALVGCASRGAGDR